MPLMTLELECWGRVIIVKYTQRIFHDKGLIFKGKTWAKYYHT